MGSTWKLRIYVYIRSQGDEIAYTYKILHTSLDGNWHMQYVCARRDQPTWVPGWQCKFAKNAQVTIKGTVGMINGSVWMKYSQSS